MSDQSEQINELATALAKAQAKIENAEKEGTGNFGKYATLGTCWNAVREPLSSNGLAVIQTMVDGEKGLSLVTTLVHSSGQWMRSTYPIRPMKSDPQGFGSAITYARRYTLSAIVGLAPEDDDDGESAMGRGRNGFDALDRQKVPREHQPVRVAPPPKKAALPPIPDEITVLPRELLEVMGPLRPLGAVPLRRMQLADYELILDQVRAFKPKFTTPEGQAWLTALHGTVEHLRGEMEAVQ